MRLTESDMHDLVMILAWMKYDRYRPAPDSEIWQAGRRLAKKCGGGFYERFIAAEQQAGKS